MTELEQDVLRLLGNNPRNVNQLVQELHQKPGSDVRRAVWRLLDLDKIQANWNSEFVLTPTEA